MELDIQQLEQWFLSSILGVVVLGATGSIVATIFIKFMKVVCGKIINSSEDMLLHVLYPFVRSADVAEAFRDEFEPKSQELKYLSYLLLCTAGWIFSGICAIASFLFLIYAVFLVGFDDGLFLSASIAVFLYFFQSFLKESFSYLYLIPKDMIDAYKQVDKVTPKNYKEWNSALRTEVVDKPSQSSETE
ncbi:hypothetical protein [Vibrio parahaemolyticus]|uniref:hypothetical protein n=1 Tax=Vibrio parahaemolyticus TaxID=670 RepID=UPI001120EDA7|nr:hypothetical protein [Vibrio parahaemolyticus]TOG44736.1 hypothetical protein CGJ00_24450 [Vibrio parahaemolyticus]